MAYSDSNQPLRSTLRVLFSRLGTILLVTLAAGGATAVYCVLAPRYYQSEVKYYQPLLANPDPLRDPVFKDRQLEVQLKSQRELILSTFVLSRTFALLEDPALRAELETFSGGPSAEYDPLLIEKADAEYTAAELAAMVSRAETEPNPEARAAALREIDRRVAARKLAIKLTAAANRVTRERSKELDRFYKSIKIRTPGGEDISQSENYSIVVEQPADRADPTEMAGARAQRAADILSRVHMARHRGLLSLQAADSLQLADSEVELRKLEVQRRQLQLSEFISRNLSGTQLMQLLSSIRGSAEAGPLRVLSEAEKQISELSAQREGLSKTREQVERYIQAVREHLAQPVVPGGPLPIDTLQIDVPPNLITDNSPIRLFMEQYVRLQVRQTAMQSQFNATYEGLAYVREEIRSIKLAVVQELSNQATALANRMESLNAEIASLEQLATLKRQEIQQVAVSKVPYDNLLVEVDTAQKALERALVQRDEIRQAVAIPNLKLLYRVDEATLAYHNDPVRPLLIPYVLVALLAGFLLGLALAFTMDYYDPSLRDIEDAERYTGVPVLGRIPRGSGQIIV